MFASFARRLVQGFGPLPATVCVLAGFVGGCSGEDEVTPQLGRACAENSDCGSGLVCARGGDFAGLCTASCTNTTDCETRFGDGAVCALDYCTLACDHTDECGPNGYCGVDLCFGGKAGISDTCSGSSQCERGLACLDDLNPSGSCVAPSRRVPNAPSTHPTLTVWFRWVCARRDAAATSAAPETHGVTTTRTTRGSCPGTADDPSAVTLPGLRVVVEVRPACRFHSSRKSPKGS
jgi:hypothetical protein